MQLEAKPGRGDKIHISIDGEYKFTVDASFWYASKYAGKKELTEQSQIDCFYSEIGTRQAYLQGLRFLSYGDHSKKEMFFKLRQKGNKDEHSLDAIEKLCEYGYIDESRYARTLASRLIEKKHLSKKALKMEMRIKGLPENEIDDALAEIDVDPSQEIMHLLETKFARYLDDEKGIKKTVSSLQRLGYSWGEIKSQLSKIKEITE